jgi:hypothetical protein
VKRAVKNKNLQIAKKEKNDEFYTLFSDIERELKHYKEHFENKTVYCNCDNPNTSNFPTYFVNNFQKLGLKKLIVTCYNSNDKEKGLYVEYNGDDINTQQLKGNGDFRTQECIELLQRADIVVTNPPFSLFREYIAQLIEYNKKFLIVGSENSISTNNIFHLIKNNKLWLGNYRLHQFEVPDNYKRNNIEIKEGFKFAKFGNICWYTNLYIEKRNKPLLLQKQYNSIDYPEYDNYNAISIDSVNDIPIDYNGIMGVPITFISKYNPDQFEIIGSDNDIKIGLLPNLIKPNWKGKIDRAYLHGLRKYARIFIKHKSLK